MIFYADETQDRKKKIYISKKELIIYLLKENHFITTDVCITTTDTWKMRTNKNKNVVLNSITKTVIIQYWKRQRDAMSLCKNRSPLNSAEEKETPGAAA